MFWSSTPYWPVWFVLSSSVKSQVLSYVYNVSSVPSDTCMMPSCTLISTGSMFSECRGMSCDHAQLSMVFTYEYTTLLPSTTYRRLPCNAIPAGFELSSCSGIVPSSDQRSPAYPNIVSVALSTTYNIPLLMATPVGDRFSSSSIMVDSRVHSPFARMSYTYTLPSKSATYEVLF